MLDFFLDMFAAVPDTGSKQNEGYQAGLNGEASPDPFSMSEAEYIAKKNGWNAGQQERERRRLQKESGW